MGCSSFVKIKCFAVWKGDTLQVRFEVDGDCTMSARCCVEFWFVESGVRLKLKCGCLGSGELVLLESCGSMLNMVMQYDSQWAFNIL